MKTLYINNRPLFLSTSEKDLPAARFPTDILKNPDEGILEKKLSQLKEGNLDCLKIKVADIKTELDNLGKYFQVWKAAGGLVVNKEGEILLLFRRKKWDLPKGKVESYESSEEAALREIAEETGLQHLHIKKELTDTWHSYPISFYKHNNGKDSRDVLKQTTWYLVNFSGTELTIPQIEEDIMDVQWIKPKNIGKYMKFSYPNIQEVFKAAGYL